VTGVDAQSNRLDSRSAMGRQNYGDQPWDPQATMWNAGAFGELTWFASDAARVIGGARIDYERARQACGDERDDDEQAESNVRRRPRTRAAERLRAL
jgi:outer membrane receptor protein involved in Fe transport